MVALASYIGFWRFLFHLQVVWDFFPLGSCVLGEIM